MTVEEMKKDLNDFDALIKRLNKALDDFNAGTELLRRIKDYMEEDKKWEEQKQQYN